MLRPYPMAWKQDLAVHFHHSMDWTLLRCHRLEFDSHGSETRRDGQHGFGTAEDKKGFISSCQCQARCRAPVV